MEKSLFQEVDDLCLASSHLSAKTGDEFALLRSKEADILFHGSSRSCRFVGELEADHEVLQIGIFYTSAKIFKNFTRRFT